MGKKKQKNKTYELSKKIRKPMPPPGRYHKSIKDYDRKKEKTVEEIAEEIFDEYDELFCRLAKL